jgi:RimJ/RimL family protein N-acetyltransferase
MDQPTAPVSPVDLYPMLGLRITAGPLELRGITDDLIVELAALAQRGVHDPHRMPFTFPWTDVSVDELPARFGQYHWRTRAEFTPQEWTLNLAVSYEGQLVGVQGMTAGKYLVTRTGETGSWLGREHHGRGIGTLMRQVFCGFCFDHLDAAEITSAAFSDNPASLGVSKKVGYVENGRIRRERRAGELATTIELLLRPEALVRAPYDVEVAGVAAFRRQIGLDSE